MKTKKEIVEALKEWVEILKQNPSDKSEVKARINILKWVLDLDIE